jgi:hypothetical protein
MTPKSNKSSSMVFKASCFSTEISEGEKDNIDIDEGNRLAVDSHLGVSFHMESGVHHHTTIPYSKDENGIVERANKEVNRHIRNILFD